MLHIWLVVCTIVTQVFVSATGCTPASVTGTGFKVQFYNHPLVLSNQAANGLSTFNSYGKLGAVIGVTQIDLNIPYYYSNPSYGAVYGYPITTTNFSMRLSGYFLATQTGLHLFSMQTTNYNNFEGFILGSCCSTAEDLSESTPVTYTNAYLTKGLYYPMTLFFVQLAYTASISMYVQQPDSSSLRNGAGFYQIAGPAVCFTTQTNYWTETSTRVSTASGILTQTVIVDAPYATRTTYWTESVTSASTYTPPNGAQPTVYIEIPRATATTSWTGSFTTTTTVTPYYGAKPTVIVKLPAVPTQTSVWTGSYTTLETVVGTDGLSTPVVQIPAVPTLTSTWSGLYTTMATVTGSDGQATPVLELPVATSDSRSLSASFEMSDVGSSNSAFASSSASSSAEVSESPVAFSSSDILSMLASESVSSLSSTSMPPSTTSASVTFESGLTLLPLYSNSSGFALLPVSSVGLAFHFDSQSDVTSDAAPPTSGISASIPPKIVPTSVSTSANAVKASSVSASAVALAASFTTQTRTVATSTTKENGAVVNFTLTITTTYCPGGAVNGSKSSLDITPKPLTSQTNVATLVTSVRIKHLAGLSSIVSVFSSGNARPSSLFDAKSTQSSTQTKQKSGSESLLKTISTFGTNETASISTKTTGAPSSVSVYLGQSPSRGGILSVALLPIFMLLF